MKAALGEITLDDVVTKASNAFSTLTKGLDKIATAFTLTTNSVTAFFEGFAVGVKGFASAFLYTSGEIIYGWTKMAEVVSHLNLLSLPWKRSTTCAPLEGVCDLSGR